MIKAKAINHLGIAVKSIDEAREYYENVLGGEFEGIEEVAEQKVKVAFFKVGDVRLELLEPTSEDSPISGFLEKRGEGIHHVAYTVDKIEERIAEIKEAGLRMINEEPRNGAHNSRIAFMHPKSSRGVLTELCEPGH
ncbi:methylmalonyl-CoA epimerase [Poriferisphaera sp. WC338]|uniref:methylmalonyl-CoA epimerase n=1 Tax=Poriferisphaera sp. WC338 TaxID=3425129 RepID=UPI003D8127DD